LSGKTRIIVKSQHRKQEEENEASMKMTSSIGGSVRGMYPKIVEVISRNTSEERRGSVRESA
jgi:hypothetical protein